VEIINACIKYGCRRLVFTASMAVYGNQQTPFNETMYPMPIDPYGVAKAAVERDIQIAGDQHGLSWTIIRPHNVYGPGQDLWTPYRNVLGIWMARTFQNLPMRIYGDGEQVRAFSYIDDCLPCLWRAATLPTTNREIINLGGTKPVSINVAASTLLEIMERGDRVYEQARHEVKEAWCTWEKSAKLLGYQDHTPLEVGLERMWDWAQEAWRNFPERRHQANFNYEIKSGIYPYWENLK
jgi:UDP-glucose 4-epimerase